GSGFVSPPAAFPHSGGRDRPENAGRPVGEASDVPAGDGPEARWAVGRRPASRPVIPFDLTLQAWAMGRGDWRAWGRRRTPWAKVSAMPRRKLYLPTYLLTYHGPEPLSRTFSLCFRS